MDLNGKVALLTGADSGTGQATAVVFAKAGADVCITFHTDEDGAKKTKRQVEAAGWRALVMQRDVGDAGSVQAVFDRTAADLGTPDLLVANAGTGMGGMPVADMDDAKMMEVLQTDLVGPLFCARALQLGSRMACVRGPSGVRLPCSHHRADLGTPVEQPKPAASGHPYFGEERCMTFTAAPSWRPLEARL